MNKNNTYNTAIKGQTALRIINNTIKKLHKLKKYIINNKMKLEAIYHNILSLKKKYHEIVLYTDIVYLKNGIIIWFNSCDKKNWNKDKIKNIKLWQKIYFLNQISWEWIKSHNKNSFNEKVNQLTQIPAQQKIYKN